MQEIYYNFSFIKGSCSTEDKSPRERLQGQMLRANSKGSGRSIQQASDGGTFFLKISFGGIAKSNMCLCGHPNTELLTSLSLKI